MLSPTFLQILQILFANHIAVWYNSKNDPGTGLVSGRGGMMKFVRCAVPAVPVSAGGFSALHKSPKGRFFSVKASAVLIFRPVLL